LFFLVNLSFWLQPHLLFGAHLWSIGVEEQFYIMWPLIFRYLRWPLAVFMGLMALKMGFHYQIWVDNPWLVAHLSGSTRDLINNCASMFHYEAMATGAVSAYVAHAHGKLLKRWISKTPWLFEGLAAALFVIAYRCACENLNRWGLWSWHELPMLFYAIAILILSHRESAYSLFDLSAVRWFGQRSYGFYVYHLMMNGLAMALLEAAGLWREGQGHRVLFYVVAFGFSVGAAALSYRFLESPVLRLKDRYFRPETSAKPTFAGVSPSPELEREIYALREGGPTV
jgi:peptidoglycan/LPS O-acetylase OafA/YrhL